MIKLCLNPVGQPLPVILFTLFLSLFPIRNGSYLLANDAGIPANKSENSKSKYHHPPAVSFQMQEDDPIQSIIEWDKTIGGSSFDVLSSAILTPDGAICCQALLLLMPLEIKVRIVKV